MPGWIIGPSVSQLWTNRGLTLLPFTPVPQGAESRGGQEDGKESRKPRKDAAALVLISVGKTECHAPAGDGAEEDASLRS